MQTLSMSSGAPSLGVRVKVRASWDTEQRLPYNRNAPRKIKKNKEQSPTVITLTASNTNTRWQSVVELLRKPTSSGIENNSELDNDYLGYERWLPSPPKVEKPRSTYNASALAYIGDCIYEDALLQKLLDENYLTQEERDVLRWGKNVGSAKTRTRRRAGVAVYNRASSLETLIGYLYLRNVNRLEEVMQKLGFSTGDSKQTFLGEANGDATRSQASESNEIVVLGPRKEGYRLFSSILPGGMAEQLVMMG